MVLAMPFTRVYCPALNCIVLLCAVVFHPALLSSTQLCSALLFVCCILCSVLCVRSSPNHRYTQQHGTAYHITSQRSAAIVMTRMKSFLTLKGNVLERTDTVLKNLLKKISRTSNTAVVGSIVSLHLLRLRIWHDMLQLQLMSPCL